MSELKKKNTLMLVINLFLAVSTVVLTIIGMTRGAGEGQLGENMDGIGYFKAFTTDSNVLCGISAIIAAVYNIKILSGKANYTPKWVTVIYLISTCAVSLTLVTVIFFLGPMVAFYGHSYFMLFAGNLFFFHFLNPVLAIIVYAFIWHEHKISKKTVWLGVLPTFIYSVVYTLNVAFLKNWTDFYNFTFGGHYYLIPVAMMSTAAVTLGAGFLLNYLHNRRIKPKENTTSSAENEE